MLKGSKSINNFMLGWPDVFHLEDSPPLLLKTTSPLEDNQFKVVA